MQLRICAIKSFRKIKYLFYFVGKRRKSANETCSDRRIRRKPAQETRNSTAVHFRADRTRAERTRHYEADRPNSRRHGFELSAQISLSSERRDAPKSLESSRGQSRRTALQTLRDSAQNRAKTRRLAASYRLEPGVPQQNTRNGRFTESEQHLHRFGTAHFSANRPQEGADLG